MHLKTTFFLLLATYLISVIINSLKSNGSFVNSVVPLIILGTIFLSYSVLSITLTLKLSNLGYFNWISAVPQIKNITLVVGLIAVLYSIFISLMIKADWSSYQHQSISNPLDFLAYTSYIWVPILMIIPFGLLTFSNEYVTSQVIKMPIIINVILGAGIFIYSNFGFVKVIFAKRESEQEYGINQTIKRIQNERQIMDVLYFTRPGNDKKVMDAALTKIKSDATWEYQLIKALENCENNDSFREIYQFLSIYKVDKPDQFLNPFANSIECLADLGHKLAGNQYASPNDLDALSIEKMLSAIEHQFGGPSKILSEKLSILEDSLKNISREDFGSKKQELVQTIEVFRSKFK